MAFDEGSPVDEFDYDSGERDVNLNGGDLQGKGGDINSSNKLDPDQFNGDEGLDLYLHEGDPTVESKSFESG